MSTRILCVIAILACTSQLVWGADKKKAWPKSAPISGAQIKLHEWTAIEEHGAPR